MIHASSQDFGKEVAATLGQDPSKVQSIDIHIRAGEPVTAVVGLLVTADQAGTIVAAIRRQKIVLTPTGVQSGVLP